MGLVQAVLRRPDAVVPVHPNHVLLRPPINVSPFIRFCRWSALGAGIAWGMFRYQRLKNMHMEVREYEHNQEMTELKMQARIKQWIFMEEMESVLKAIGMEWNDANKGMFGVPIESKDGAAQPAGHGGGHH